MSYKLSLLLSPFQLLPFPSPIDWSRTLTLTLLSVSLPYLSIITSWPWHTVAFCSVHTVYQLAQLLPPGFDPFLSPNPGLNYFSTGSLWSIKTKQFMSTFCVCYKESALLFVSWRTSVFIWKSGSLRVIRCLSSETHNQSSESMVTSWILDHFSPSPSLLRYSTHHLSAGLWP